MKKLTYKVSPRGNQFALVEMETTRNGEKGTTICYYFSRETAQEMADHLNQYPERIATILYNRE